MVMAHGLLQMLHRQSPNGRVEVLAPPTTAPLTQRMPQVAATHIAPFAHGKFALAARIKLGRQLRNRFDAAIVLPNSWKSALVPFFAAIPRRSGFVGEFRYGLLNDVRVLDAERLPRMAQRFAWLGMPRGSSRELRNSVSKGSWSSADGTGLEHGAPNPCLRVTPDGILAARARFALTGGAPVLALCPGAEFGPAKRWPPSHFAAIAQHHLRNGYQVWIFGGVSDTQAANEIIEGISAVQLSGVQNLTGKTSLLDAVDLLAAADRVVSNDSGLMHVAAALGKPVIGIYGSSSPGLTPPLGPRATTVSLALSCSPCFARTCRFGHYDCLRKLGPDEVIAALTRMADAL